MFVVKNLKETASGNLECEILNGETWSDFVMAKSDEYEVHESSGWPDIKPCGQAEKDAHEQSEAITGAINAVQGMLDKEAQKRGYDDVNAIGKYIGYDNPFRAECEALGAWTAACWSKCYELQSGGVMPSDLLAEMPKLAL